MGYAVTWGSVAADADTITQTVSVEHDFPTAGDPRRIDELIVYLDGEFFLDRYEGSVPGLTVTVFQDTSTRLRFVWAVDRGLVNVIPGRHTFVVSLWPASSPSVSPVPYTSFVATVPPRPIRTIVPGRILRNLFWTDPLDVRSLGQAEVFRAAGVNCLTTGIFISPADRPGMTLSEWRAARDSEIRPGLEWANANGFYVLGTGDGFLRTTAEQNWLHDTSWAEVAVTETVAMAVENGVVAVAVVDEIGGTPDDHPAFADFLAWWRAAGGPLLGWPAPGTAFPPPFPFEQWAGSDYVDRYWTDFEFRPGQSQQVVLSQMREGIKRAGTLVPTGRPWSTIVTAMGPFYTKEVPGGNYVPGSDTLEKAGCRATDVTAQVWTALAYGAGMTRAYAFDSTPNRSLRSSAVLGYSHLETGVKPGDDRWAGLEVGYRMVAAHEPELTRGHHYPPVVENGLVYGRIGELRWVVNTRSETVLADRHGSIFDSVLTPGEVKIL